MSRRILIIGAGSIAGRHLAALGALDEVRIVGVCDRDRDRAEALAGPGDVVVATDAVQAIEAAQPDVVVILTPRGVREEPIGLCLERRIPFLVEKPPCDRLDVGERLAGRLAEAGLLHTVGFMHRWHEALNAAMAAIAGDTLGLIAIRFVAPFASTPVYDRYPDPYLVERSGGLVGDQGIHYLDLARYLSGSEAATIAVTGVNRLLPRSDRVTTVDTACWTLVMANGVVVDHAHTWCGPHWDCRVELVTDRSRIVVDMFGNTAAGTVHGSAWEHHGVEDEFRRQHRGFLAAVAAADPSLVRSPYADAVRSFALAEELNRRILPATAG